MAVAERRGRAMASQVQVLVHGPGAERAAVHGLARLAELEATWSRFRPDSELVALNRAAGRPVVLSADAFVLVDTLVRAWAGTGGLCDASVLPALLAAGYVASTTDDGADGSAGAVALEHPAPGLGAVELDVARREVRLPEGVALDPGAVGKGLAADLVAVEAVVGGARGALVSIGGDLRAAGHPPEGGWPVTVEAADGATEPVLELLLDNGGVATSSSLTRTWVGLDGPRHHVIDPSTGRPATTDLASATVLAPTAWEAEARATAAMVRGTAAAYAALVDEGTGGVLQTVRGGVVVTPDLSVEGVTRPGPLSAPGRPACGTSA